MAQIILRIREAAFDGSRLLVPSTGVLLLVSLFPLHFYLVGTSICLLLFFSEDSTSNDTPKQERFPLLGSIRLGQESRLEHNDYIVQGVEARFKVSEVHLSKHSCHHNGCSGVT